MHLKPENCLISMYSYSQTHSMVMIWLTWKEKQNKIYLNGIFDIKNASRAGIAIEQGNNIHRA